MTAELSDRKLEVYKALREEIVHHIQAMSALLGVGLTASAAIGGFSLNKHTGDRQALLVLPFVLSGLALAQMNHEIQIRRLGEYIRTYVWPSNESPDAAPSWEQWIADVRIARSSRQNPAKAAHFAANVVVFGVPSIGALLITIPEAWHRVWLGVVWGLGLCTMVAVTVIVRLINTELKASDGKPPRSVHLPSVD